MMRLNVVKLILLIAIKLLVSFRSYGQTVDMTIYLPENYVTDGSIDYTAYMQHALDRNQDVTFPDFPVLINEQGLSVYSNQVLNFSRNSQLIMKPNFQERFGLLNLKNVENVVINNPNLKGDRDAHLGKNGEWGMGVNILSSRDVTINNPNIQDFWGDGIYIGEIHYTEIKQYRLNDRASKNVVVAGGKLWGNRRNGISIVNVRGLIIKDVDIRNSNGTAPMAGICMEPNNNSQFLENIKILGVVTENNPGYGISYVPSSFYGKEVKDVSIEIENCKIIGSKHGIYLGGLTARVSKKKVVKLKGTISVKNCNVYSSETALRIGSNQKFNPQISIKSFSVYKDSTRRDHTEENAIKKVARSKGINIS